MARRVDAVGGRASLDAFVGGGRRRDYASLDLTPFRDLPADLWSEALLRANESVNLYVDLNVHGVLRRLGVEPGAPVGPGAGPAEQLGVAESRRASFEWLLAKIVRAPSVVDIEGPARSTSPASARLKALPDELLPALRARLLEEEPALAATLELIDLAAAGFPAFLRGELTGEEALFRPQSLRLWGRYFDNGNPVYAPINRLTAFVARRLWRAAAPGRARRVLEVGAGCGSASEALIVALCRTVSAPEQLSYRVTDVSPAFLREARQRLDRLPLDRRTEVSYGLLDLDRPPTAWNLEENSVDLIVAVNVLHTVRDLVESLRGVRRFLRRGGRLLLGECVRPAPGRPVHPEFVFQLIEAFRAVNTAAPYRRQWGFLDAAAWRCALGEAGFSAVTFVPDFEAAVAAYPEHSLAAIVADPWGT